MTKLLAGIRMSVDAYIAGPNDGPGKGLGEEGGRPHYWVFGDPWTYESEPNGEPTGEDTAWRAETVSRVGAVVEGRWHTTRPSTGPAKTLGRSRSSSLPTDPRKPPSGLDQRRFLIPLAEHRSAEVAESERSSATDASRT
jgi:hypothetical protein